MSDFSSLDLLLCSVCVSCSSSTHRAPGKKVAVPIYNVLVRPGRDSNSRPTSTEADALITRPRAGPIERTLCAVVWYAFLSHILRLARHVCTAFKKGESQMLESQHVCMRASVIISQFSIRLSFMFSRLSLWKNKDYQVHRGYQIRNPCLYKGFLVVPHFVEGPCGCVHSILLYSLQKHKLCGY